MNSNRQSRTAVVVLNWNGEEDSLACIEALSKQTCAHQIVAVDNGSEDNFSAVVKQRKDVVLLENKKNLGFAGGVNTGIRYAMENDFDYVALINNDARPNENWLEELFAIAQANPKTGIVTGKLLKTDGTIDSTGDIYTSWGLPYPRGRGEKDVGQYDNSQEVFAASGGASLYRVTMFKRIGLFDEDFFAYYEDVDLSFRAQLAGWKVVYTPNAVVHHKIGASSSKIPGFTAFMTMKNLPYLFWKNVPLGLLPKYLPRFIVSYTSIVISSLLKGKFLPTLKGVLVSFLFLSKKFFQRYKIQNSRTVETSYIDSIVEQSLPPNAAKLRRIFYRD